MVSGTAERESPLTFLLHGLSLKLSLKPRAKELNGSINHPNNELGGSTWGGRYVPNFCLTAGCASSDVSSASSRERFTPDEVEHSAAAGTDPENTVGLEDREGNAMLFGPSLLGIGIDLGRKEQVHTTSGRQKKKLTWCSVPCEPPKARG